VKLGLYTSSSDIFPFGFPCPKGGAVRETAYAVNLKIVWMFSLSGRSGGVDYIPDYYGSVVALGFGLLSAPS